MNVKSWRGKIISAYEQVRAGGRDERQYAYWNHVALVANSRGTIVEAGTAGVVLQHLEKYRDDDYRYVAIDATPEQRLRAVRFAVSRVGSPYATLALAGLAISTITLRRVRVPESRNELCGSLVARALACAGEHFGMRPIDMLPADLASHYGVAPSKKCLVSVVPSL